MVTASAKAPRVDELDRPFFQLASECPVEAWLSVLGHRWCALIVYHLRFGPLTFGGIRSRLPTVAAKVLSERLSQLQSKALVTRDSQGREVVYSLTEPGEQLLPILDSIEVWSREAPRAARHIAPSATGVEIQIGGGHAKGGF